MLYMDAETIETVGLIITHRCNLNCVYCYISEKQNKDMPLETAASILAPHLSRKNAPPLQILLMGGEPLLAFDMIRELISWCAKKGWDRKYCFFTSTNGTLLTKERKEWISRYKDVLTLALSYDGLPMVQDRNRTQSSSQIDLDFFLENWPWQKIQMTIDAQSVYRMADGVIYLLEHGFDVNANAAYEKTPWPAESIREYARQLRKLVYYYNENPSAKRIYQFCHPFAAYAAAIGQPMEQERQCGAGDGFVVYDNDKKPYPCHMLSPLVMDKTLLEKMEFDPQNKKMFFDMRCEECPYIVDCPTCIGCNYRYRGEFWRRDKTHCLLMQIEVLEAMKLEILRLKKTGFTKKDIQTIQAIKKLYQYINKKR